MDGIDNQLGKTTNSSEEMSKSSYYNDGNNDGNTNVNNDSTSKVSISQVLQAIEQTQSRNKMVEILVDVFSKINKEEIQKLCYLFDGRVAPLFVSSEFNFSEKSVISALNNLAKLYGADIDIAKLRESSGDIGTAVEQYRIGLDKYLENVSRPASSQEEKNDTNVNYGVQIGDFYDFLSRFAMIKGAKSVSQKSSMLNEYIVQLSPVDAKYLARIIVGNLRLGCNYKTILDALSVYLVGDKSLRDSFDLAYGFAADVGYLAGFAIEAKIKGLNRDELIIELAKIKPVPGMPFFPRLVQRVGGFDEAFEKLGGRFYLQPKFDGLRGQIHIGVDYVNDFFKDCIWSHLLTDSTGDQTQNESVNGFDMFSTSTNNDDNGNKLFGDKNRDRQGENKEIKIFSRNLEDLTVAFPDIIKYASSLNCKSAILDCEIVGVDKDGEFIPFQETMTRRRKYEVGNTQSEVPVKAFVFDILHLDGRDTSVELLQDRVEIISELLGAKESFSSNNKEEKVTSDNDFVESLIKDENSKFYNQAAVIIPTESPIVSNVDQMRKMFDKYVSQGFEGIILKKIDDRYIPGVRNLDWIKIKKSIEGKVVDTVDLVILGYYSGSGKQTKFGMGALLAGVYNSQNNNYEPITKIGTGITEDRWTEISSRLKEITLAAKPKEVVEGVYQKPDFWVEPSIVVQVEADEISASKVYSAGLDQLGFGLALRFPRLIIFGRDKVATDATTVDELVQMFKFRREAK